MTEQMYTTDTAAERLARSVAEAVEVGGRFSRAEFSVDDVATVLEAAVQQPNREALADALSQVFEMGTLPNFLREADAVLAILAALPIPATGEADAKWRKAAEVVLAEVKINGIPALEFIDKVVTP